MSCTECPHCHELHGRLHGQVNGQKHGISASDSENLNPEAKRRIPPKPLKHARYRGYSQQFETAWKEYGRKEEKQQAFKAWLMASGDVGGETELLVLVLGALSWQGPIWGSEAWKFAKYFERYLKARKWEDEPPPLATGNGHVKHAPESFAARDERERREREAARQEAARREQESADRTAAIVAQADAEFERKRAGGH